MNGKLNITLFCHPRKSGDPPVIKWIPAFAGMTLFFVFCIAHASNFATEDFKDYQKSSCSNPQWDASVQQGFEALDKQDKTGTITALKKAVNLGCQSPIVYFKLAAAYEATGSYYSAVQYYELAEEQFAKGKINHRYKKEFDENYGRALYLLGKTEKSLPFLINAAKTSNHSWLLKVLAQEANKKGNSDAAASFYERLVQNADHGLTKEELIPVYLLLARTYQNKNDEANAKKYYQELLSIDPKNTEATTYLSILQLKNMPRGTENSDKALEILEKH